MDCARSWVVGCAVLTVGGWIRSVWAAARVEREQDHGVLVASVWELDAACGPYSVSDKRALCAILPDACDRYMNDSVIVEAGTHDELLKRQGEYARIWMLQAQAFL